MKKASKAKSKAELEALDQEFAFFLQNEETSAGTSSSSRPLAASQRSNPPSQNSIQRTLPWAKKPSPGSQTTKASPSASNSVVRPSRIKHEDDDSDIEIISAIEFSSSQSPRRVKKEVNQESAAFGSPSGMSNGLEHAIYGRAGAKEWMKGGVKNERDLQHIPGFGIQAESSTLAGPPNGYFPGYGSVYAPSPTVNMPGAFPSTPQYGVYGLGYTVNNIPRFNSGTGTDPIDLSSSDEMDIIRRAINAGDEGADPRLEYIVNDPRKSDQEIKELLANIRPDEELPIEDREGTPEGLKYPLVCCLARVLSGLQTNPVTV